MPKDSERVRWSSRTYDDFIAMTQSTSSCHLQLEVARAVHNGALQFELRDEGHHARQSLEFHGLVHLCHLPDSLFTTEQ